MTRVILVLGLFLLNGCAAFGVAETSDPSRKISQAYFLMDQCRPIPAERITGEALALYLEKNDEIGMAEAYHTFGNFYKFGCYHTKYEKYLLQTIGSHEKAYERSKENFQKAADLYEKNKDFMGASKSYFGVGNVYGIQGDHRRACESYEKSLQLYALGKAENPNANENIRTGFKDTEEMIGTFKAKNHC